ncbi:RILP-like protein 2 [Limanda limanda]|uniref:RILP-like protein 2 n=1 Tax=Limanda limanda TaxID=27771 RepID=UPI0029C8B9C4|nr:RILP-like protein 2 [Limanda limanda]
MDTCGIMSALDRPAAELTVMDVYDIAAVLGHEFERIIDRFGCESLVALVPKVVRVLEQLEALVSRGAAGQEAEELRGELERLRQERSDKSEQERRHQKELELVEDVWRGEVQDLLPQITRLQAENKRLLVSLKESPITEEDKQEGMSEKERRVRKKLEDLVEKQRDEIRAKDHELTLRNEDVDALQMQQNRVIRINQDLRHRIGVMEAQGKALIQQRAELQAAAQAQQQEVGGLQLEITRLSKELRDWELEREISEVEGSSLTKSGMSLPASPQMTPSEAAPPTPIKPKSVWVECGGDPGFMENCFERDKRPSILQRSSIRENHEEEADEDEEATALLLVTSAPGLPHTVYSLTRLTADVHELTVKHNTKHYTSAGVSQRVMCACCRTPQLLMSLLVSLCPYCAERNVQNVICQQKVPADTELEEQSDSPEQESDKPRFTLQELRDVLQERNELKAQVFVLQEDLAYYKSDESEDDTSPFVCASPPPPPCSTFTYQPESGIRRLIFTAIMPMVAAGLITDDPTLLPIRRLSYIVLLSGPGRHTQPLRTRCGREVNFPRGELVASVMEFGEESSPALAFEKDAFELTVEDVYDISYVIGRDLLKVSRTGDEVSDLQFRIVRVLEMFETLVNKYNLSVEELRMERDNLKTELDRLVQETSSGQGTQTAGPNQLVVDLTDPNRPRFTMQELKEVLQERNQLKAQLLVAQEELQLYKSGILPQAEPPMVEVDLETPETPEHSPPTINNAKEEKTTISKLFSFRRK